MSEKRYNRASEYILDKFFNIKTHEGEYTFLKAENSGYFQLYKEFIIVLLNQGFNDDHLLQTLNQLSLHVDRVNQSYHIDHPDNTIGFVYAYGGHMDFKKHFLRYKDVFITFFEHFPSHSDNYSNACKALMNIGYEELDKYKSNLPLFRLLVQNGFSCRVIEREYMKRRDDYRDPFRRMDSDFFHYFHHNPRFDVVDSLFSMADYKEVKIKNNKELLDLLLKENLITLSQDKKDFVTGNPTVSYLLKVGDLTVSELRNNPLKEIKEKVKEAEAQSNLPETHNAKAPMLAKQVMGKSEDNQNEVQPLLTSPVCQAIKTKQKEGSSHHK